eukprot:6587775-Prymnesium_polylepis.1
MLKALVVVMCATQIKAGEDVTAKHGAARRRMGRTNRDCILWARRLGTAIFEGGAAAQKRAGGDLVSVHTLSE